MTSQTQGSSKIGKRGWWRRARRGAMADTRLAAFERGTDPRRTAHHQARRGLLCAALAADRIGAAAGFAADLGRLRPNFALRLLPGPHKLELAGFFAPSVRHWSDEIGEWAARSDVDAHLLATVMQIESCGHPSGGQQRRGAGLVSSDAISLRRER